jgi:hypothetical protein
MFMMWQVEEKVLQWRVEVKWEIKLMMESRMKLMLALE